MKKVKWKREKEKRCAVRIFNYLRLWRIPVLLKQERRVRIERVRIAWTIQRIHLHDVAGFPQNQVDSFGTDQRSADGLLFRHHLIHRQAGEQRSTPSLFHLPGLQFAAVERYDHLAALLSKAPHRIYNDISPTCLLTLCATEANLVDQCVMQSL